MTIPSKEALMDLVDQAYKDAWLKYSEFGGGTLKEKLICQQHLLPFWPDYFKGESITRCPKCGVIYEPEPWEDECPHCLLPWETDCDNA